MSLTDIDKVNQKRDSPQLNSIDQMSSGSVKAHATDSIAYRSEGGIQAARVMGKDDQIIVFDGSYNKALLGRDGNGDYVVKIAQDGVDVLAATDEQLIFNSQDDAFVIVDTVTLPLSFTRSSSAFASYVTDVDHGLTYTPEYQYDLALDSGLTPIPPSTKFSGMYVISANVGSVYTPIGQAYVTVSATKVYFQIDISSLSSGTYSSTATVYLLQKRHGQT